MSLANLAVGQDPQPHLVKGSLCPGILIENASEDTEYYKVSYEKDHEHLRFYRCARGENANAKLTYESSDSDSCKLIARKDASFPRQTLTEEITPIPESGLHKAGRYALKAMDYAQIVGNILSPGSSNLFQIAVNANNEAKGQISLETPIDREDRKLIRVVIAHALYCRNWTVAEIEKNNLIVKDAKNNHDNLDLNLPTFDQEQMNKEFRAYLGEIASRHSGDIFPEQAISDRSTPASLELQTKTEQPTSAAKADAAVAPAPDLDH